MLMREWNGGSAFRRWLVSKPRVKVLTVIGLLLASISIVMVVSLVIEGPAAVWLPEDERDGNPVPQLAGVAVVSGAVGFLAGWGHLAVKERRARRLSVAPPPRPTSAFLLGLDWMFVGWRLWTFGAASILAAAVCIAALLVPDLRERAMGEVDGGVLVGNVIGAAWMIWALTLKGRELQRGKAQVKVADEYLAIREARLHHDFNAMWQKRLEQQQAWEAEKTAQLYEQILDQQARGLLPCPNCSGRGDQRKSA